MFFNVIKSLALGVIAPFFVLVGAWLYFGMLVPVSEVLHLFPSTIPFSLFLSGLALFGFWAAASAGIATRWFAAMVVSVGILSEVVAAKLVFFNLGSWLDVGISAGWGLICCLATCGFFQWATSPKSDQAKSDKPSSSCGCS